MLVELPKPPYPEAIAADCGKLLMDACSYIAGQPLPEIDGMRYYQQTLAEKQMAYMYSSEARKGSQSC